MNIRQAFDNFLKENDIFYMYYSAFNDPRSRSWRLAYQNDQRMEENPSDLIARAFSWSNFNFTADWYKYSLEWTRIVRNNQLYKYYTKTLNVNIRVL